ncbi:hypothetical protein EJ06DRAFT_521583 [Trichodelitschia bisporula]|uniref:Stress-response A/B barrel domain-containing protein n=1 Tax=Trichodelitschia bisporula TaxID=703511 RepID=A0A6G1HY17_9PEZI|nr:hypothetical protein EJ06DRAFT_521583 [Trichodelitschia bisporula]
MSGKINRITLFKLPNSEDVETAIAAFTEMQSSSLKDGKPYILSLEVKKLHNDPRSQGYTLISKSSFASLEEMKFYDDHDEAHKKVKSIVGPKIDRPAEGGVLTLYMDA